MSEHHIFFYLCFLLTSTSHQNFPQACFFHFSKACFDGLCSYLMYHSFSQILPTVQWHGTGMIQNQGIIRHAITFYYQSPTLSQATSEVDQF